MTKITIEEKLQLQQHSYFSENLYSVIRAFEAVEKMMSFLDYNSENTHEIPSFQSSFQDSNIPVFFHHARLPRIDIPKFNGSSSE